MILVDEIGDVYPHVNHSPWHNVTLADFVMPWYPGLASPCHAALRRLAGMPLTELVTHGYRATWSN